LRWILLTKEYGVIIEYLPGVGKENIVADDLCHLDINSQKIQEEEEGESLTILSGSEK
jgi:hypothetical protein